MVEPKLSPDQRKLVDEYVEVREKCRAWRPEVNPNAARLAELQPLLIALAGSTDPERPLTLKGKKHVVPVSRCELRRTILRIPALFRRLGAKWVAEHCKPTLTALEKSPLSPEELASFIHQDRTGPRTLGEPVPLAAVKAA